MELFIAFLLGVCLTGGMIFGLLRSMGFAAQRPHDYDGSVDRLDLKKHLNGSLICEGVIFGPTGRVTSRFVADMEGIWDGDTGVLREHFVYDSGETQDREWRLTLGSNGHVIAEADDVEGQGKGQRAGSGFMMNYDIRLPESSGGHVLSAVDWMYLVGNGTIVNRSQFHKYGIKVAELVATIRPKESANSRRKDAA